MAHERAVEDHDLVAFDHAGGQLHRPLARLGERVDKGDLAVFKRGEHIVVAQKPGEPRHAAQALLELSRVLGHHEHIAGKQHLGAFDPRALDALHHFVTGNKRFLDQPVVDQLEHQTVHLILLAADRLDHVPHAPHPLPAHRRRGRRRHGSAIGQAPPPVGSNAPARFEPFGTDAPKRRKPARYRNAALDIASPQPQPTVRKNDDMHPLGRPKRALSDDSALLQDM